MRGHLIGDMADWKKEQGAIKGFLMSYADDGSGYKLRKSDYENLIDAIIYRKAVMQHENSKPVKTKEEAKNFIKANDIEIKEE